VRVGEVSRRVDVDGFLAISQTQESWIKLGEICEVKRGKFTFRPRNAPHLYGGKYPFIQTGDVAKQNETNSRIKYSQTLNEEGLRVSRLESEKCILITIAANIGDTAILDYPACFPDSLVGIKLKDKRTTVEFIHYILKFFKQNLLDLAPQVAQKNITIPDLENLQIPLPPLETQQKLVQMMDKAYQTKKQKEQEAKDILDGIDDFVLGELGIKTPKIKDFDTLERVMRNRIFALKVSELKNNRFDPEYHLPKNKKLLQAVENGKFEVVKLKSSYKIQTQKVDNSSFDFINYIDLAGINKDTGRVEKIRKLENNYPSRARQKVKTGDLLISSLAGSLKGIALVEQNLENMIASTGFFVINQTENNLIYLASLLKTEIYQNLMLRETAGGIMSALSKNDLENIKIPLPPLQIQQKIAEEVEKRRSQVFKLQVEAMKVLKTAKDEFEKEVFIK